MSVYIKETIYRNDNTIINIHGFNLEENTYECIVVHNKIHKHPCECTLDDVLESYIDYIKYNEHKHEHELTLCFDILTESQLEEEVFTIGI